MYINLSSIVLSFNIPKVPWWLLNKDPDEIGVSAEGNMRTGEQNRPTSGRAQCVCVYMGVGVFFWFVCKEVGGFMYMDL